MQEHATFKEISKILYFTATKSSLLKEAPYSLPWRLL